MSVNFSDISLESPLNVEFPSYSPRFRTQFQLQPGENLPSMRELVISRQNRSTRPLQNKFVERMEDHLVKWRPPVSQHRGMSMALHGNHPFQNSPLMETNANASDNLGGRNTIAVCDGVARGNFKSREVLSSFTHWWKENAKSILHRSEPGKDQSVMAFESAEPNDNENVAEDNMSSDLSMNIDDLNNIDENISTSTRTPYAVPYMPEVAAPDNPLNAQQNIISHAPKHNNTGQGTSRTINNEILVNNECSVYHHYYNKPIPARYLVPVPHCRVSATNNRQFRDRQTQTWRSMQQNALQDESSLWQNFCADLKALVLCKH